MAIVVHRFQYQSIQEFFKATSSPILTTGTDRVFQRSFSMRCLQFALSALMMIVSVYVAQSASGQTNGLTSETNRADSADNKQRSNETRDFELLMQARGDDWHLLEGPNELLDFLTAAAKDEALAVISVDWLGCPACGTGSAYIEALAELPERYKDKSVRFAYLYWRDPYDFRDDLQPIVTQSYKLFLHLTATKRQFLGGAKPIETFTVYPPNWRPKFPQLFFLDGNGISESSISVLISLHQADLLFHPQSEEAQDDAGNTITRCLSGDLNLTNSAVRYALENAITNDSVLLQLTNYHLYRAAGDHDRDFVNDRFLESCDCVVHQFETQPNTPGMCFRFERPHE